MFVTTFLTRFTTAVNAEQLRSIMGITIAEATYMVNELAGLQSPTFAISNNSDSEEDSFGITLTLPSSTEYDSFRYIFRQVNNQNYIRPYILPVTDEDGDNLDNQIKMIFNSTVIPSIQGWTHSDSFTGVTGTPSLHTLSNTPVVVEGVYLNGTRIATNAWSLSTNVVTLTLTAQTPNTLVATDTIKINYTIA